MTHAIPRALGLDIGTKTIGLAISDALGWTARPLSTIRRKSWAEDLAALHQIQQTHGIAQLVVGLPLGREGEMTEQARYSQRAAERIQQELDLPVAYVDESLSSAEADVYMQQVGVRRKKRKQNIDQQAAALILQDYLDEQQRLQRARQAAADPRQHQEQD